MTKRPFYGIIETIEGIFYAKEVHKDKRTGTRSVPDEIGGQNELGNSRAFRSDTGADKGASKAAQSK